MIQTLFGSLNEPERKGIFDRMKDAVTRTRETLTDNIDSVLALTREVDEASLEELEFSLIASDIGVTAAKEITDSLRELAKKQGISNGAELKKLLKAELKAVRAKQRPAASWQPGIAGTIARCSCARRIRFALLRLSNWKCGRSAPALT
jgi:fused signal recognition particle receptor